MSLAFIACAIVTAISATVSLGFSLAALRNPGGAVALYACARSAALAVLGIVPFFNGRVSWLEAVALGMVIVQALDAAIGVTIGNRLKTFGPACTAIANLAALAWLARVG